MGPDLGEFDLTPPEPPRSLAELPLWLRAIVWLGLTLDPTDPEDWAEWRVNRSLPQPPDWRPPPSVAFLLLIACGIAVLYLWWLVSVLIERFA